MKEEVITKYRTNDGNSFDTEEQARKYEKITEAKRTYDSARAHWLDALADAAITADGKPYNDCARHWYLEFDGWRMPQIKEFESWNYYLEVNAEGEVFFERKPRVNYGPSSMEFKDLYQSERKAESAWEKKAEEFIESLQKDLKEIKAKF